MNGFDIRSFRSEINNSSILQTHSFMISFAPFSSQSTVSNYLTQYLNKSNGITLRCDQAVLPGMSLLTNDNIRRYGMGPVETIPYDIQFTPITLTWIVDEKAEIINFFNKWVSSIINFNSAGGRDMQTPQINGSRIYSPYEVGYKDDYSNSKMTLFMYDKELNNVVQYSIFDIYPTTIQDTQLSWSDTNNMLRLSVTFAYTDLTIKTVNDVSIIPRLQDQASNITTDYIPFEHKKNLIQTNFTPFE